MIDHVRRRSMRFAWFLLAMVSISNDRPSAGADDVFQVTEPVVCKSVEGLKKYVRRDPPELTTFDKLIVYVEPTGFATKTVDGKRKAVFVQNGKVRAAGSKKVVIERAELLRFEPEVFGPGATFYLAATVGFKNMPPGEYVLELETMDEAAEPARKVLQVVPFKIVKDESEGSAEKAIGPERTARKPARKSGR